MLIFPFWSVSCILTASVNVSSTLIWVYRKIRFYCSNRDRTPVFKNTRDTEKSAYLCQAAPRDCSDSDESSSETRSNLTVSVHEGIHESKIIESSWSPMWIFLADELSCVTSPSFPATPSFCPSGVERHAKRKLSFALWSRDPRCTYYIHFNFVYFNDYRITREII